MKELHNDHIVRYHDRYVDRDAGILYILMEYCGGGDLSSVIKQSLKHNRSIPEDMIWLYFMQICRALYYCHHPNGTSHGRPSSVGGDNSDPSRRSQILHRDLKPDNGVSTSSPLGYLSPRCQFSSMRRISSSWATLACPRLFRMPASPIPTLECVPC